MRLSIPPPTFLLLCPAIHGLQLCAVTFLLCKQHFLSVEILSMQRWSCAACWSMSLHCNLFRRGSCHCIASYPRWPRRILNLTFGQTKMLTIDYETPCVVSITSIDHLSILSASNVTANFL